MISTRYIYICINIILLVSMTLGVLFAGLLILLAYIIRKCRARNRSTRSTPEVSIYIVLNLKLF